MTTHDPALEWAAERAGLSYERFVEGLTRETKARIRAAYFRQNGSTIPVQGVLPAVEAEEKALAEESGQASVEAVPAMEAEQPLSAVEAVQPSVESAQADAETALRADFQANMHTLPPMVSAWKYKKFLEGLHVRSKAERKLLEKIVREEIRSATEQYGNRLTHFLWWLDGQ